MLRELPNLNKNVFVSKDESNKRINILMIGPIVHDWVYTQLIHALYNAPTDYTVHFMIDSPGGSVVIGTTILNAMDQCDAKIITYNVGIAASMGAIIWAFGDERKVTRGSRTMFHFTRFGMSGETATIAETVQCIMERFRPLMEECVKRGCLTREEFKAAEDDKQDQNISAKELVDRGAATYA